jgi:hypothetical protein
MLCRQASGYFVVFSAAHRFFCASLIALLAAAESFRRLRFGAGSISLEAIVKLHIEPRVVLGIEIDEEEVAAHFLETLAVVVHELPSKVARPFDISLEHLGKTVGAPLRDGSRLDWPMIILFPAPRLFHGETIAGRASITRLWDAGTAKV